MASLADLAPTALFRCTCSARRSCDYHRADWPLLLDVVIEEFRAEYGGQRADLDAAEQRLSPSIERRLRGRRRCLERAFASSLFSHPMLATAGQWTDGQHRCQAAMDVGCEYTLFAQ